MNTSRFLRAQIFSLAAVLAVSANAQPLPKVELKPAFPALKVDQPVWISEAPDGSGRLFVVEHQGRIVIVKKGSDGADAKEFFNIVDRKPYNGSNEEGLMSLAFHPGFKTNGLFYVYYNQLNNPDQHSQPLNFMRRSVISEFKVSAADRNKADLASERILLQVPQPFSNHKGGEVAFGPDGYLYLGLGDGGSQSDPLGNGQNTSTLLAKMIRIDVNSRATVGNGLRTHELAYGFPSDNPFINESEMGGSGPRKEIFAYGFRNPWRYSFDSKTGDLWVGDVGQDLWEEVDLVTNGGNYGWSVREGAHAYKPGPAAHYAEPVIEYPHNPGLKSQAMFPDHSPGLCVIGGYVYHGKKYPALEGVYIYGDYNLGTIWGLRYDRAAKKVTEHATLLAQKKNIFSFAEDGDGEVYVLMQDGGIYFVVVP